MDSLAPCFAHTFTPSFYQNTSILILKTPQPDTGSDIAHSYLEGPLTHGPPSLEGEGGGNRLVIPGGGTFESPNLLAPALEVRTLTA